MSQEAILSFQNVSKRFEFEAKTSQSGLKARLAAITRSHPGHDGLWAVEDVSFDLRPGESLGIIGRNGSGKSTLLKLATGIIRPTNGVIQVRGRLSALLELGAGFHPELSGQENIYLNGSILGMSKAEIGRCYDAIVAFSELDEFIHMPVKHYSSGMYMRLGFSVAVHVQPELLIVDEILAVGDQAFQEKCLDRILDMRSEGVSILLVSHNLGTIRNLCTHLIWLDGAHVRASGPADDVIEQYLDSQERWPAEAGGDGRRPHHRWGSREVELTRIAILDGAGRECSHFVAGETMLIELHYRAQRPVAAPEFGLGFFRRDGVYVSGPDTRLSGLELGQLQGEGRLRYRIGRLPLTPGVYVLSATAYDRQSDTPLDFHDRAYSFRVVPDEGGRHKGLVEFQGRWEWAPAAAKPPEPEAALEGSL
ncbi:MAG: ABC transporter ATP-binding protein [Candidatus Promineifilaceae bacterium]